MESKTYDGMTALNIASAKNHIDIVQYLISKSANIKVRSNKGATPLHTASYNGHIDIVQYLVSQWANI